MDPPTSIAERLAAIRNDIARAARDSARDPAAVRLIAISKTHPAAAVREAIAAGQRDFGENTVQEALPKISEIDMPDVLWHFVGHLQSNKAKHIPGHFQWLHSIDNLKIAQRLSRFALEQRTAINVLIEINITGDPNKEGIAPQVLPSLLERLLLEDLRGVTLCGLMAMGPYPASERQMREAFAKVRQLREQVSERFKLDQFNELSMGMSGDYVPAVREGATMVRIGTAIFGERDYTK